MSEELPRGWANIQLSDVCSLLNGRAYKQSELLQSGKYPVLRVGNFFSNPSWYYSNLELEPQKYCDSGDLLYAWSASFGPKIWNGGKVIFHYRIWKVELDARALEKKCLYYWFDWDKENIKAAHGTGSTMIHVTKGDMEERKLLLPPLPEQKRITAKIDQLFTSSNRAREHINHIPRLVEKYKESILRFAFRGDLTASWRANNKRTLLSGPPDLEELKLADEERGRWLTQTLPEGWEWRPFERVFDDVTDSKRKLPQRDYLKEGSYAVIDQGEVLVGGYTNDKSRSRKNLSQMSRL